MKFEKIKNKGQARLFENRYLEYMTKTHPFVIWSIYLPLIIFLIYFSSVNFPFSILGILTRFLSGVFFWSLFEYLMHRFAFHLVSENLQIQRLIYVLHGNHHEFPRDRERLFMPPIPSLILASLLFFLFHLALESSAFVFFSGFLLGYLIYGSMHFAIHAWAPPFKFLKPLWRNHHLHHYKSDEKGFGVSSSFWDWVFGSGFDLEKEKEDKERVRELMY